MKSFWTWLQTLLTWKNETSKEFATGDYQQTLEKNHYDTVVKFHRPVYDKTDKAS